MIKSIVDFEIDTKYIRGIQPRLSKFILTLNMPVSSSKSSTDSAVGIYYNMIIHSKFLLRKEKVFKLNLEYVKRKSLMLIFVNRKRLQMTYNNVYSQVIFTTIETL